MRIFLMILLFIGSCGDSLVSTTNNTQKTYYYVKEDKPTLCQSMMLGGEKSWVAFTSSIKIIDSENAEYEQACNDAILPLKIGKDLKFSNNKKSVTYENIQHDFGKKLADIPVIRIYYYVKDNQPTLCDKTSLGREKNSKPYTSKITIFDSEYAEYLHACNDNSSPIKIKNNLIFSNNNNSVIYKEIRHDFGVQPK